MHGDQAATSTATCTPTPTGAELGGVFEPVAWDEALDAFVVSGFEEASSVLRGPGWSSDPRRNPLAPPQWNAIPPGVMLFMDAPGHTRLRGLIGPAFGPRAIGRLRPRIAAIADAVVAGLAEVEEIDVVGDIARLVPLAVIAELLDIGHEGAELLLEHTPGLVRLLEVEATPDDLRASAEAITELIHFLTPLLAERRRRPGADFISALLTAGADGDGLALEEVMATCILLLAAGHETTAGFIANATLALLRHPEQRRHLLADPDRAIEELLRFEGPVKLAGRVALSDHDLGGHRIAAGRQVFVRLDRTGRDPRRLPDPERLDLTRDPVPHLAMGGGPHYCLGAALARLEAREILVRLFTRFPRLTLVPGPARRRESTTFHGLTELLVRPMAVD